MAITCPSCGMENPDAATECRRCRAPFAEAPAEDPSASLGLICQRCEAYNEPGVARCTTCGYKLTPEEAPRSAARPAQAEAMAEPLTPAGSSDPTLSEELHALAISAEEAADAGVQVTNGAGAAVAPAPAPDAAPAAPSLPRGWAAVEAAMGGGNARKGPVTPPPEQAAYKTCQSCAAENAPAAKFCSECGTPFAKAPPADARQPNTDPPPTVSVLMDDVPAEEIPAEDLLAEPVPAENGLAEPVPAEEPPAEDAPEAWAASTDPTARPAHGSNPETSPINLQDPSPEPLGWEEPGAAASAEEVPMDAAAVAELIADPLADIAPVAEIAEPEPEPPFQASLVVEHGSATGTTYLLGHIENVVGSAGAAIELSDDPHLAPRHAAIVFDEQRVLVRDEGSANGVYLKIRESAAIEPGDYFVAGERLLRFDGPCELPVGEPTATPYLGSPRPQGTVVRVSEVLRGGKTGRTCFRSGPAIAVGRTGCDLNFASDTHLAPRHAELRIAADGSATLVDLGASPGGVFLRLRPQQSLELQAGDIIQLGDQVLRLEVG